MYKAIIFDFNGTMVFDGDKHFDAWNQFAIKYRGKALSKAEMDLFHGKNNEKIIEILCPNLDNETKVKYSKAKEAMYRDSCYQDHDLTLVAGLANILDEAKAKDVKMNIASASIKDNIDFYISFFNLASYFDCDKIIYDDGLHDDKVSMFLDAAAKLNVDISECVIIEDSFSGLKFAHEAKCGKLIAICDKSRTSEYEKIDYIDEIIHDYTKLTLDDILQ